MIGNDIIDLKHIASNWNRPRYLEKVFSEKEQELIFKSEDQHQMFWLLWSMKEAAYKCHVRCHAKRFFNPKRLKCELISEDKGVVKIDSESYFTKTIIMQNYIYTLAKLDDFNKVTSSIFKTKISSYNTQSHELKHQLLKAISKRAKLDYIALSIQKNEAGVPSLFKGAEKLAVYFSLTHCGRYSGFAIL